METHLACLPVDVLLDVFRFLSARDIIAVGSTCRYIHRVTNERCVWIQQYSALRTQFPFVDLNSLSIDHLRSKVIHEGFIAAKWQKNLKEPQNPLVVHQSRQIGYAVLFPGGEYIIIVHVDGEIHIKSVMHSRDSSSTGSLMIQSFFWTNIGPQPRFQHLTFLPVSETSGVCVLELACHGDPSLHIRLYSYSVDSPCIKFEPTSHLIMGKTRQIQQWVRSGSLLFALYTIDHHPNYYVSCIEIPTSSDITPPREVRFELSNFDARPCVFATYGALAVVSPRRIVVSGVATGICVYNLPPELQFGVGLPAIPLHPIWKWENLKTSYLGYKCSPIFYENGPSPIPMLYIIQGSESLHFLKLRASGNPVMDHRILPITCTPQIGFSRGVWCSDETEGMKVTTLTLSESSQTGSFFLPREIGFIASLNKASFDDTSGRVCFVAREAFKPCSVYVAGVVDAKHYGHREVKAA